MVLASDDVVFAAGSVATAAYYISDGQCHYMCLWAPWIHLGLLFFRTFLDSLSWRSQNLRNASARSRGAEEPETGHATCPGGGQPPGWFPHFLRLALEVTPDRFLLREWEVPGSDPTVSERMEPLPTALHKGCAQPRLIGCGECRVTEGRMDLLICCQGVSRSG